MANRDHFRLGTGAGFSADRLDPAADLVAKGRLDAIVFECIGERTLAFGHRDRMATRRRATTRCWSGACAGCCRCAPRTARA
jgi:Acyclic terpene utilisation family protein AtuA